MTTTSVSLLLLQLILAAAAASAFLGRPLYLRNSSSPSKTKTETSINNILSASRSSIDTLQQQIINGATLKLIEKDASKSSSAPIQQQQLQQQQNNRLEKEVVDKPNQYTYYIREAKRSEIPKITDVLMSSFHSQSQQPTFDSYIRRYKQNHLYMCFDAINESDRGIFVACASSSSEFPPCTQEEILVGFCLVDGRNPDPSCKIENLTPSTLASTSPRPYLSDLGVIPSHRRKGLGELLVQACEGWADQRGYDKLYLKVEEKNTAGVGLYYGMGYKRTKLPWGREVKNVESRFDTTLLLEKSLVVASPSKRKRKRTWIKEQLLGPMVAALNSNNNNLPL
jgi:ribosomal protein S18 acetylase RimI-like enzyme